LRRVRSRRIDKTKAFSKENDLKQSTVMPGGGEGRQKSNMGDA